MYALDVSPMEDLKSNPNVVTVQVDLSNWSQTRSTLTAALKNVDVHGLVNNAGITICKPFEELTEEDYDK